MKQYFEIKSDVVLEDIMFLHPALLIMLSHALMFCSQYDIKCKVTSIIADRDDVRPSSKTHSDGRAVDISVKGWSKFHIKEFINYMEENFSDIAAISASDKKPRPAVYHNVGWGDHIHLQVRPKINLEKYLRKF